MPCGMDPLRIQTSKPPTDPQIHYQQQEPEGCYRVIRRNTSPDMPGETVHELYQYVGPQHPDRPLPIPADRSCMLHDGQKFAPFGHPTPQERHIIHGNRPRSMMSAAPIGAGSAIGKCQRTGTSHRFIQHRQRPDSHPGERMDTGGSAHTEGRNTLLSLSSGYGRECLVRMTPGRKHLYPEFGIQNILHEILLLVQIGWV